MLMDKSSKLPADFFMFHEGDLKHHFVIGPTGRCMSAMIFSGAPDSGKVKPMSIFDSDYDTVAICIAEHGKGMDVVPVRVNAD